MCLREVLDDEQTLFTEKCSIIEDYIENPESKDCWIENTDEIQGFLDSCNQTYNINYSDDLQKELDWIKDNVVLLSKTIVEGRHCIAEGGFGGLLAFFSNDPSGKLLKRAINVFDDVVKLADKSKAKAEKDIEDLRRQNPSQGKLEEALKQIDELTGMIHVEEVGRDAN